MHKNMSLKDCAVVYIDIHLPGLLLTLEPPEHTCPPTPTRPSSGCDFFLWHSGLRSCCYFCREGGKTKQNNQNEGDETKCTQCKWSLLHNCSQSQKCELSFHQGVWTLIPSNILQTLHHNVRCIYNTYSRGNSLLHSPTRKEKNRDTTTTPPHPAPTHPAIQLQPAHPRVLCIHVTYVHRQTRLRYHSGPCSSWRGSAERKRSSFSCPCLWLLLHGCCAAGKDITPSMTQGWTVPPTHPWPTPSLSSIFPVPLFQTLQ